MRLMRLIYYDVKIKKNQFYQSNLCAILFKPLISS